jgi:hypothetical protein
MHGSGRVNSSELMMFNVHMDSCTDNQVIFCLVLPFDTFVHLWPRGVYPQTCLHASLTVPLLSCFGHFFLLCAVHANSVAGRVLRT